MTPLLAQRPRAAVDRSFEQLYHEHVHAVYRYALAVLHNEADAEDVTQNTFLSAYRAFQRGEQVERPHNWLIKIAHNVCRQRFRDSSRRPKEVEFDDALAPAATEDSDVPSATEIRRALGFLGFNQRAALVMRELEGRSYAEISQILDVTVGAVETLIFRARRALREQLEGGLTCEEAGLTLERLHQQKLSTADGGALRAHLRECKDCAVLERRQRAQRRTLKKLGAIPLPASLTSFGSGAAGGGALFAGMGIGAKIATVLAAGLVATGLGEAVNAIAAKDSVVPAATPARLFPAGTFSSVALITGNRSIARRGETTRSHALREARRAAHGFKARQQGGGSEGANGSAGSGGGGSAAVGGAAQTVQQTVNGVVGAIPKLPEPPVQIPQLPQLPVQLPPPPPLPPIPPAPLPPPPSIP
ncbi:MAG: RNA polymerase sigma factor [Actinomycetota bacterium]